MTGPDAVRGYFRRQSRGCISLGSPFMGRLMRMMADWLTEDTVVGRHVLHWPGDPSPNGDNPSLRLAGALHALVLSEEDEGLASVYPPNDVLDGPLWTEVSRALVDHEAHLMEWLRSAPQTNEVRRSAALIPALHMVAAVAPGPLHLWEIGCSAGLNLCCDRFGLLAGETAFGDPTHVALAPEWDGPTPEPAEFKVRKRRGVDLKPLDPTYAEDRLRLLAYLWPDQVERKARTHAAITLARTLPIELDREDAVDWLAENLSKRPDTGTTVIYHTIAWQYVPPEARARGEALIAEAGAAATAEAPLVRIALEADGRDPGAGLSVTVWPEGTHHELARVDYHGRWVNWTGPVAL